MNKNTEIPEELPEILFKMFENQNIINGLILDRIEKLEDFVMSSELVGTDD